jgi:HAD superfamily hydrolase (TIGR01509 family)
VVSRQPIRAIVFDCDGVLLDTQKSWTRAEVELAAAHGRPLSKHVEKRLLGASVIAAASELAEWLDIDPELVETELSHRINVNVRSDASPLPGAHELVAALSGRLPMAVATNGPKELLLAALESTGFNGLFRVVVAADDVMHPKPEPDLYELACTLLGVPPGQAIAVEDSTIGVEAAQRAGLTVIGVGSLPEALLEADLAVGSLLDETLWDYFDV